MYNSEEKQLNIIVRKMKIRSSETLLKTESGYIDSNNKEVINRKELSNNTRSSIVCL